MDGRTGSITVTALVGTGLATLVVSLTGVAGLSGDLQAAAIKNRTTPSLTPGEEQHDTSKRLQHEIILKDACDKAHHHKGTDADTGVLNTTPVAPAATTPSAREF